MDLNNLKCFLESETIPVIKNKIGFLEIIRKQHYETINSNIYAHFLSCDIDEVRSLFLDALLSIIYDKSKKQLIPLLMLEQHKVLLLRFCRNS